MASIGEHNALESFDLTSYPGHNLETLLARLTCSQPDEPCLTLLPQLQPSVDAILATLSPTDAEVFRSALDGVTLISHTPPFAKQPPPLPLFPAPGVDVLLASSNASMRASNLPRMRDNPVFCFAYLSQTSDPPFFEPTAVDLRYAARAALRLTQGELDDKIRLVRLACSTTWTIFAPLVAFRHACAGALSPLIDLGPPLAGALGEYAWTWRTCPMCARHSGRGACELFCADAPWFVELWRELVAILRARPDPDAVLTWGKEHFARALKEAMECPICSEVAEEQLKCFEGLLVVEATKRIAEAPFAL